MHEEEFPIKKHLKFISKCIKVLPSPYAGFQNSRPTALFFLISGLDILNKIDSEITQKFKYEIIDWIYSLQIDSKSGNRFYVITNSLGLPTSSFGFRGSGVNPVLYDINKSQPNDFLCTYESAHITQTYTALCCLLILGDDFSRLDSTAILSGLSFCQKSDGRFFFN